MPEVRATTEFFDMADKTVRHVGSEFNCDDDRAANLAAYGMVEVIGTPVPNEQEAEQVQEPEAEAPKARKRTRKKKA